MTEKTDHSPVSVSIGRQPIFDKHKKLWGYQLFCVGGGDEISQPGGCLEGSIAVQIQSSAYVSLQQITDAGRHVMLDFSEKSILDNLPYVLPPKHAAVRIFENGGASPAILESLGRLKADGYLVAIAGFSANPDSDPLYKLADIISIEVDLQERAALDAALASAQQYPAQLLAMRVQTDTEFKSCRDMGFALFHGPFFKSPEQITVRKLSSNEVVRFNLLQAIEHEEFDVARLAETIQSDVTLTLRLLAYLNSAAFGFQQKVKSVSQAITLLGSRQVTNWLRVVLLSELSQSKDAHELVVLSAQRALFLELIARDHDFWGFAPESVHLLGLFSLLDALLGVPMKEVVANLPLDHKMKAALCREPNNEYLPLLQLAQSFEEARWEDGERLVQELNLDGRKVKKAFQDSLNWASELDAMRS